MAEQFVGKASEFKDGERQIIRIGEAEIGVVAKVTGDQAKCKVGDVVVRVDPRYFRPTEVETLLGDPSKAKAKLGWSPKTTLQELVSEMVESDYATVTQETKVELLKNVLNDAKVALVNLAVGGKDTVWGKTRVDAVIAMAAH